MSGYVIYNTVEEKFLHYNIGAPSWGEPNYMLWIILETELNVLSVAIRYSVYEKDKQPSLYAHKKFIRMWDVIKNTSWVIVPTWVSEDNIRIYSFDEAFKL